MSVPTREGFHGKGEWEAKNDDHHYFICQRDRKFSQISSKLGIQLLEK